ncbi:hypothetical protein KO02_08960 [Sphingobacterium sp. ML3W]|nr:hypothetical protein KO02_08960 [Sphingobacterium sp. ML3W]
MKPDSPQLILSFSTLGRPQYFYSSLFNFKGIHETLYLVFLTHPSGTRLRLLDRKDDLSISKPTEAHAKHNLLSSVFLLFKNSNSNPNSLLLNTPVFWEEVILT